MHARTRVPYTVVWTAKLIAGRRGIFVAKVCRAARAHGRENNERNSEYTTNNNNNLSEPSGIIDHGARTLNKFAKIQFLIFLVFFF